MMIIASPQRSNSLISSRLHATSTMCGHSVVDAMKSRNPARVMS